MKKNIANKIVKIAEGLAWNVNINNNDIIFSKFSPENQDFNIEIMADNLEEVLEQIKERCENYDVSYETYLWLGNTGHGINGAPNDMKDLYEDMEACLKMMEELRDELEKLI